MDFDEIVAKGLEQWLKERRDNHKGQLDPIDDESWHAVDDLLNELRECLAMGFFPWSEEAKEYYERDN